jgi:hypothetical protein
VRLVAKGTYIRRLVSMADRPCKLHLRQDSAFPFPGSAEIKLPACYGLQEPELGQNPRILLPITLLTKPLVGTPDAPHRRSSSSFLRHIRLRRATAEDLNLF